MPFVFLRKAQIPLESPSHPLLWLLQNRGTFPWKAREGFRCPISSAASRAIREGGGNTGASFRDRRNTAARPLVRAIAVEVIALHSPPDSAIRCSRCRRSLPIFPAQDRALPRSIPAIA